MKKKLMALAALATCVTIGGVYAGWLYADKSITGGYTSVGLGMSGIAQESAEMGTITVESSNISLQVDDDPNDSAVHTTTLKWNTSDYFTIKFTTHTNAEEGVKQNGITLQWHLGMASHATATPESIDTGKIAINGRDGVTVSDLDTRLVYENEAIFTTYNTDAVAITDDDRISRVENGDGSVTFTYRIWLGEVLFSDYVVTNKAKDVTENVTGVATTNATSARVALNRIVLPTRDDYNAYRTKIDVLKMHFHVGPATTQN